MVWPAALDNVIAVGVSNCQKMAWEGSSRGPEVNISAPAQNVWHAAGRKGALKATDPPGTGSFQGSGTSFATPAVAGLAACWLAHHGRAALIQRYGHARFIPRAFAHLLRTTAFTTPPNWKTKLLGPGLIDGGKLLSAPLPDKNALKEWPKKEHSLAGKLLGGLFKTIFAITPAEVALAAAKSTPMTSLRSADGMDDPAILLARRFGGELRYHLFDQPGLLAALTQDLTLAGMEAASTDETVEFAPAPDVAAALKALASPSLAEALP